MLNQLFSQLARLRNSHFFFIDIALLSIIPLLALAIRLEGFTDISSYAFVLGIVTLVFSVVKLAALYAFGFYKRDWHYASIDEMMQIASLMFVLVILETLCFQALYALAILPVHTLPRTLPILDGLLSLLLIGGLRFSVRLGDRLYQLFDSSESCPLLIVGAGDAGVSAAREIQRNLFLGLRPVAFIDDDPRKSNLRIAGLPVVGNCNNIPEVVSSLNIQKVLVALPDAPRATVREITGICQTVGVKTVTLPSIDRVLKSATSLATVPDVCVEDLLRRDSIQTDIQEVTQLLSGKRVLITGAGGSIGSELCRQILRCNPSELILVGKGENSIFNIEQDLEQFLRELKQQEVMNENLPRLSPFITDIRSQFRLEYAFRRFKPEIIFHAAAHKHVPLMEMNSPEAITNNVLGTKHLIDLAAQYNVSHFVMISTDKAVNPTNVMGASKRVAEMLVLQAAKKTKRAYVVVRFGNVLGSRGSVIPTFKRQIAAGGPVMVTHPDICRYFMTIPEAVQLVLQAAVVSGGGELCMLDMGQPVKIVDLAKDLILLSGYVVGKDIEIVYTGLRPGEKLFEELFIPGEEYERTRHKKILVVRNASRNIPINLEQIVEQLCNEAAVSNPHAILVLLEQLVEGYTPDYSIANGESVRTDSNTLSVAIS